PRPSPFPYTTLFRSLFLLGLPTWMVDPVLAHPSVRGLGRFLTHPLICGLIYTLVVSLWHVPLLYDLALRNKLVHVSEHLMFFGADRKSTRLNSSHEW